MPDRIDSIVARLGELQKKIDDILGENKDQETEETPEPRLTMMDVDSRIKALVPKIVIDELESAMAKNEAVTRSLVMSAIQEGLAPSADPSSTVTSPRKPASKRKKVTKEE